MTRFYRDSVRQRCDRSSRGNRGFAVDDQPPEGEGRLVSVSSAHDSELDTSRDALVTTSTVCFLIDRVTTSYPDGIAEDYLFRVCRSLRRGLAKCCEIVEDVAEC